jgi:hypothetical protein
VIEAIKRSNTSAQGPDGGIVAVKVQYPDALPLFMKDLGNIRSLAGFLSRTELKFDMVSAVDELSSQVRFEFDFKRCEPSLPEWWNCLLSPSGLMRSGWEEPLMHMCKRGTS